MAGTSSDGESVSIANVSGIESWFGEAIKLDGEPLALALGSAATANESGEKESGVRTMTYEVKVASGLKVAWQLAMVGTRLFVAIPDGSSLDGARDAFVSLLELAEERLHCEYVVVLFRRERTDRAALIKTFMYIGFVPLAPGNTLTGGRYNPDFLYLAYKVD